MERSRDIPGAEAAVMKMARRERWYRRGDRLTVALALAFIIYGLVTLSHQGAQINSNRVEQTRTGCRERNEERKILHDFFKQQLEQTRGAPAAAFEQFKVPKSLALSRYEGAVIALTPLPCRQKVREVRDAVK